MSKENKDSNYGDLSIKELLSRLKVTQVWAVITIALGLLAGSFTLGYKISRTVSGVQSEQLAQLRKKDTFLSLFLRYELAKNKVEKDESSHDEYENAREALDEFVHRNVEEDKLDLGKGEGRLATIQFSDGTNWTIPSELHVVEEH